MNHNTQELAKSGLAGRRYRLLLILASLLILFIAGYIFMSRHTTSEGSRNYMIIKNEFGKRKKVRPADGVQVTLNVHTILKVPDSFDTKRHEIELDGDAFFQIVPNSNKRIVLHTGMLNIATTGASFRIQAHRESPGQTLELLSGKAKVSKAYPSQYADPEFIGPGEMVMINKEIDLMEKEIFDTTRLKVWKEDMLVFKDTPFHEAIHHMEGWYGITIEISGNARDVSKVNGTFTNTGLTSLLDSLCKIEKCRYKIRGNKIRLSF